ncbi:phage portal protein [Bradyrhizobium sp. F1.13.3]|uniref:phage portal protein n=1 Tax=Bradyrhizobium sp. F1.13.3 TaxID=3156351 RepID=UPI0033928770
MMADDLNKLGMPHGLTKVATPRGEARSISSVTPQQLGQTSDQGGGWFGPSAPMRPVAPEVAGRAWDYVPGYNLATIPRTYEPVTFEMLRRLADAYDPVRLIIERRKDQMTRLPWTIRVKHDGGPVSARTRGITKEVTEFFKFPTEGVSFRAWLRQVLEDLLVLDAPAIYCERDPVGNLTALSPTDGATIKRIISEAGRVPRPFRWNGTAFDFLGQTVTAANYQLLGFRVANGLMWPPAFQQVLKGVPAANLSSLDLVYAPINQRTSGVYGFSPVQQIITTISTAFRRSMSQHEYFREGNVPEGVFSLPESWTPDQTQRFQDSWDAMLAGNIANRRKMRFVPSGKNNAYQPFKEPPLKSEFDEWLIRIVCFAFSYPPAAFVSLANRSLAEQHERTAEEEGVEPLKQWAAEMINGIIQREFDDEVEFVWTEEAEVDQKVESEIIERLVTNGIITANEGRQRLGLEPSTDVGANKLMAKTATGFVSIGNHTNHEEQVS